MVAILLSLQHSLGNVFCVCFEFWRIEFFSQLASQYLLFDLWCPGQQFFITRFLGKNQYYVE